MRQKFGLGIVTLAVLMAITSGMQSAHAQAAAQSGCSSVGGAFVIDFIDQTTAIGTVSGDLQGSLRGVVLKSEPGDKNTVKFTTEHAIITIGGDLIRTADTSVFTPVQDKLGVLIQTQTIKGGSGRYTNATGTLTEVGTLDMTTGQGVLRYNGMLCTNG